MHYYTSATKCTSIIGDAMTLISCNEYAHIKHFAISYLTFVAAKIYTANFWVTERCSAVTNDAGGKYCLQSLEHKSAQGGKVADSRERHKRPITAWGLKVPTKNAGPKKHICSKTGTTTRTGRCNNTDAEHRPLTDVFLQYVGTHVPD
jgi:uncharacterized protein YqjF (DUF2071 family)